MCIRDRYGILLGKKNINPLLLSIIEVLHVLYFVDAQVALCVYDITNKHSFQVLKNWVEELKSKGPANMGTT